ncbi:hypothetical protein C9426_09800 [Serratia sp. S1B]|nr:hypothetical protein C9426_09800 [Serratia sp. S1B]
MKMFFLKKIWLYFCLLLPIPVFAISDSKDSDNMLHFTFGITDIYSPILSEKENKDVLDSLSDNVTVFAVYTHTTKKFTFFSNIPGVTSIPDPGFKETTTEQRQIFQMKNEPGQQGILGVDMPKKIPGDYILSRFSVGVSIGKFYQQPGYAKIIDKLSENKFYDHETLSLFDYFVNFSNSKMSNTKQYVQNCLSTQAPYGFPDTSIPVVTQISMKNITLTTVIHTTCPLVNGYSNKPPIPPTASIPPARIAAAQSDIDYQTTVGTISKWGRLPVTEKMKRWYQRNDEGVFSSSQKYGDFERFSMRLRWDKMYPIESLLPIRTETWDFYKEKLIKYSASVIYITPRDKHNISVSESIYYHDGEVVFSEEGDDGKNCNNQACQNALTEIKRLTGLSWEEQQNEVQSYMQLPLIPVSD